jgi:hypothetical protein
MYRDDSQWLDLSTVFVNQGISEERNQRGNTETDFKPVVRQATTRDGQYGRYVDNADVMLSVRYMDYAISI